MQMYEKLYAIIYCQCIVGWDKITEDDILKYFYFSQKICFDITSKFSPKKK